MTRNIFVLLLVTLSANLIAQKEIFKEDIFLNRTFSQDWVYGLNSMSDGLHYTTLERADTISIDKYEYKNGNKISSIVKSSEINNIKIDNYKFNQDETLILIGSETESIYRYSKKSIFYVYNTQSKQLNKVFDEKIQLANFSPDSK